MDLDNDIEYEAIEMSQEMFDDVIIEENNLEMRELERDLADIADIMETLSQHINSQGNNINTIHEDVVVVNENTNPINLERAGEFIKSRAIIVRDTIIIVGGTILGAIGLIGGPIIGIGTIVLGTSAGIATVAGIHNLKK